MEDKDLARELRITAILTWDAILATTMEESIEEYREWIRRMSRDELIEILTEHADFSDDS